MIEEIPLTQLLSVIVPVHNESAVLGTFHARMRNVMEETGHPFEIIYVDDGSSDDTLAQLERLRADDGAVAVLELSRNFGKEVALSAGLDGAWIAALAAGMMAAVLAWRALAEFRKAAAAMRSVLETLAVS